MKTILSKNNLNIQYLNVSEMVDTTGFSELNYFFVKHEENDKEVSYFLNEHEFESLVKGVPITRDWHDSLMLLNKDSLDLIKKYGFYQLNYLYGLDKKVPAPKRELMFSSNIERDLLNNDFVLIKMVKNPNSKFAWLDLEGQLNSEPFIIDGSPKCELHNAKYYIDELAEHLSSAPNIAFITYNGRWDRDKSTMLFGPLSGKEESIGGVISEMEHHLEEGESHPSETEELNIVFYPNKDNIKVLIEFDSIIESRKPENRNNGNYFVERYIVNELLGAKEFLIEKPEEIIKVRKFKH